MKVIAKNEVFSNPYHENSTTYYIWNVLHKKQILDTNKVWEMVYINYINFGGTHR